MTNLTLHIFGIYQLSMLVRDSLGYLAPKGERNFSKDAYLHRVKSFELLRKDGTPFGFFVSQNKEKAEKLVSNLDEFASEVYSTESRIFRVSGDFVEVDASQHLRVYEMALGINQTLIDILNGFVAHNRGQEQFEERLVTLLEAEEYYYRALAHYALANDLIKLFKEYSEARAQDNSKDNPIAKFINEDIIRVINLVRFLAKYNKVKNTTYKNMTDLFNAFIEQIAGQRDLEEGKTFPQLFNDLVDMTFKTLQDAEQKFQVVLMPFINEQQKLEKENERKNPEDLA